MRFLARLSPQTPRVRFGLVSSALDVLTFGVLLWLLQAAPDEFRTGRSVESLLTELVNRCREGA
ncbi:MAG: hypothetical protein ABI831_25515 [Betaproteobacteria bacterium]